MAMSNNEIQVLWAAASSKSVASGAGEISDSFTFSVDRVAGSISCKASNNGTAVSNDYIDFYLLQTTGDPDGASTNEYDSADITNALYLGRVDTYYGVSGVAQSTFEIPVSALGAKIRAKSAAASNGITVSASINEVLSGLT
jgi:hypothetical protein